MFGCGAGRDVRLEGEELVGYNLETWDEDSARYRKGLVVGFDASQVGGWLPCIYCSPIHAPACLGL